MSIVLPVDLIHFTFDEVDAIVKKHFLPKLATHTIFTFAGPLGAGKTTLVKSFLRQAGVSDVVTSPTFTYVQYYKAASGKRFNHFDLYRLTSLDAFLEMGFDEYLYQENSYSVIEWPEIIEGFLQESDLNKKVVSVVVGYLDDDLGKRIMQITV